MGDANETDFGNLRVKTLNAERVFAAGVPIDQALGDASARIAELESLLDILTTLYPISLVTLNGKPVTLNGNPVSLGAQ